MLDGTTQRYELKWTEVDSQPAAKAVRTANLVTSYRCDRQS